MEPFEFPPLKRRYIRYFHDDHHWVTAQAAAEVTAGALTVDEATLMLAVALTIARRP